MEFIDELRTLKEQLAFRGKVEVPRNARNIVIAGMGGSGIGGKIFSELYSGMPVSIADYYGLPDFVSQSTLVIAISYSGNTEETVGLAKEAASRKASLVTISSGGRLSELGDQRIRIPRSDLNPRSAIGYLLMPLLNGFGIIRDDGIKESYRLVDALDRDSSECLSRARAMAKARLIPVVYGYRPFSSVAYRWKTQFNENSKIIAYSNSFPELNHNDTMALAGTYRKGSFYFLVFGPGTGTVRRRIEATSRITRSRFNMVEAKGGTDAAKIFYLIHYGDYLSYHLSVLRGTDPSDVSLIERLKKAVK